MSLLLSLSLALSFALPNPQTPTELVESLKQGNPESAIQALVKLAPADAMPPLVDCIRTADAEHAWHAGRAVQQLYARIPKDKTWSTSVPDVLDVVLDDSAPGPNRIIAALSVRGAEKPSKKQIGKVVELLASSETESDLRMALTLYCGSMGSTGAKSLKRQLRGVGMMKLVWTSTAMACSGKAGAGLKKRLTELIQDEESLTAFVACRSALLALEQVAGARATEKPLKKRLSNSRGRTWRGGGGGYNFGGLVPPDPKVFFVYMAAQTNQPAPNITNMSLPDMLPSSMNGSLFTLADALQGFNLHVTEQVLLINGRLEKDEFSTWLEWKAAIRPVLLLVNYLNTMDEHVTN